MFEDAFGHRAQRGAWRRYVHGVLSDSRRKSMEAMWARLSDPGTYQTFQHFITHAPWRADAVWRLLRAHVPARTGILIFDATSFPKQGPASVGVARQYCGALGKIANRQVAVTIALWTGVSAWLFGATMYLPEAWLTRRSGRKGASRQRALSAEMATRARAPASSARCRARAPGGARAPAPSGARTRDSARHRQRSRRGDPPPRVASDELAQRHERAVAGPLPAVRVTPAYDWRERRLAPEVRLLREREFGATPRTKYYLVDLSAITALKSLLRLAHQRWAIEQQHQELKDELGLGHSRALAARLGTARRSDASPMPSCSESASGARIAASRCRKPAPSCRRS